jgi:phosphoglycerate dehydrogenase-like enzyme
MTKRVAILDDYQGAGGTEPHWRKLGDRIALDDFRDTLHTENELVQRLRPYQIIVPIRERTLLTGSLLRRLPELELLSLTGKNSGHVDVDAATAQGILVTQTDGSGASAIEMTMALILASAYRIPAEDRAMRMGLWQMSVGFELSGKTLGILGLGRIGKRIAAFGNFLGMKVLAWSSNLTQEKASPAGATCVPIDDLFHRSDVVTLHLRLSERTSGIITKHHIALMKSTAWFVNTARGHLLDEAALVAALRECRIGGAALDVYQEEPLPVDHPLRSLENVVLSPHMGSVTSDAYDLFFSQAVENIAAYLDGRVPAGAVNPHVLDGGISRRKSGRA